MLAEPMPFTAGSLRPVHPSQIADATETDLIAHFGIKEVPLMAYEWGGYRYTNARDAIAAARRGEAE